MDTISFNISTSRVENNLTTSIIINGLDLIHIIAQVEQRQSKETNRTGPVGAYEGLSPFIAFHLHNHFLKDTVREYTQLDDRYSVLEYIHSGIPGDHTVACNIEIQKDKVVWSNFKNYSSILPTAFNYDDIQFQFDRNQYERAISNFRSTEIKSLYQ